MSGLDQEILTRLSTLPEQEQQEALDFIEFLQGKSARKLRNANYQNKTESFRDTSKTQQKVIDEKDISPIYQAVEQAGLIGCIETDEQLSTTHKQKLDFSFKHGVVE
jgi:hypothetical protein